MEDYGRETSVNTSGYTVRRVLVFVSITLLLQRRAGLMLCVYDFCKSGRQQAADLQQTAYFFVILRCFRKFMFVCKIELF